MVRASASPRMLLNLLERADAAPPTLQSRQGALAALGRCSSQCGGQSPDGLEAWKQVIARGYEVYVAKDEASVYEPGPTRRCMKVKQKDWTVKEYGWRRRMNLAWAR